MKFYELLKRPSNVLTVYCVKVGLKKYIRKETGLNFGYHHPFYIFGTWYLDQEEDHTLIRLLGQKNTSFFKELMEVGSNSLRKLVTASQKIKSTNYTHSTKTELKRAYSNFIETYTLAMGTSLHLPIMAWDVLVKRFEQEVKENQQKALLILTSPKKESPIAEEQKDFLQIAAKRYTLVDLKKHAERYGWMNVHEFLGQAHDSNYYLEGIKQIKDPQKQLDEIKKRRINLENERKALLAQIRPSNEFLKLIKLMQEYVYFRNYRRDAYSMSEAGVRNLLEEIGKRLNLSYNEVLCLTPLELIKFLDQGKTILPGSIRERLDEFAVDQDLQIYSGTELKKIKEKYVFLLEKLDELVEIKGDSASPGKVHGRVKIILNPKELGKVEKGDILVANMTTPEYVAAMGKSAAIVTDRGGVLCHAAIVSREMGIPCVIGTRIATKVLKDGDLVEVDANKGIVRKIK